MDLSQGIHVDFLGDNYLVFPNGRIWTKKRKKFLKERIWKGYVYYYINRTNYAGHRIIAFAFLENSPEWGNEVNHIDGNKSNNNVSNLEWCNRTENIHHSLKMRGMYPLKGRKNTRESVPLDEWEKEQVKKLAKENECSKAEYMRTAIRKQIERENNKNK